MDGAQAAIRWTSPRTLTPTDRVPFLSDRAFGNDLDHHDMSADDLIPNRAETAVNSGSRRIRKA